MSSILEKYVKNQTLHIHAMPKSSRNEIKIRYRDDQTVQICVYTTMIPENGQANKEIIKLIAKELGVPKSSITIIKGAKNKDKIIQII